MRLFLYGGKAKESGGSTDSQNLHKRISTHLLTVLTMRVIVSIEHENSVFYEKQVTVKVLNSYLYTKTIEMIL